jgi:hypothetical protein
LKPQSSGTHLRSKRRPRRPVFFFEESLGKRLPALLAQKGIRTENHLSHFAQGESDEVWLSKCGERGWIVVSKDARIRRRANELNAVRISRVRMFYFACGNKKTEEYAEAFLKAYPAILRAVEAKRAPFIARISISGTMVFIPEV